MGEIWITSGWDTVGILHHRNYQEPSPPDDGPYVKSLSYPVGVYYEPYYLPEYEIRNDLIRITEKDIYSSREEAIEAVESLRAKKINDMRKELERLESLEVKFVEIGNDANGN
jgi:uncharacterized protein YegP (UPF0339 family)